MHQRTKIRHEVISILKAEVAAVGERVYKSRSSSIWEKAELPCLCVYTKSEPAERYSDTPRRLNRTLKLHIDILVSGDDNIDDAADDIAEQVEAAMNKTLKLNDTADNNSLSNTEIVLVEGGRRDVGAARLTYDVEYRTMSPARM